MCPELRPLTPAANSPMVDLMGYPGGKGGSGIVHRIVNLIPPHPVFCSPFLGNCAVMRLKRPAAYNIGVDLDAAVIASWRSRIGVAAGASSFADPGSGGGNADSVSSTAHSARNSGPSWLPDARAETPIRSRGEEIDSAGSIGGLAWAAGQAEPPHNLVARANAPISADAGGSAERVLADPRRRRKAIPPIPPEGQSAERRHVATGGSSADTRSIYRFLRGDGLTFLASYPFQPLDLIYCDPPYLAETRSSGRLYKHEFSDSQHAELLSTIGGLPCRVMISGYWSEMYASKLDRWNRISYQTMTRGGVTEEWLWYNFADPVELHDYRFLGDSARQRQDLKRMIASWARKLKAMPPVKKRALLAAIAHEGESAEALGSQ
jgi:DNA adenine methylase